MCVIYRYGWVNLVAIHPNLLEIEHGVLLQVTLMLVVKVDIVVHVLARAEEQIGTPGVFIDVARYTPTHSPLKQAAGRRAVRPGFLGGRRRGERPRLLGQGFSLTWLHGVRKGVVYVSVGQRDPQRGNRSAVHDDVTAAAAVPRTGSGVIAAAAAAANALVRCHRTRHIF